jgi:signal transduction histidine kinase
MQKIIKWLRDLDPGEISIIVVIIIGYIVGVVGGLTGAWTRPDLAVVMITFVITAVYLALALAAENYFQQYQSGWAALAYFAIQMALVTLIILLLGPGAWLVALPMAALAVQFLSEWWQQWLVYLGIIAALILPLIQEGLWQEALTFALTLSPAILFVVVFSRLVLSEQQARRDAESLASELEEANKQLAEYSTQVEELARTKERNRLAREIHDNLGHYLTVVNVQIRAAQAIMADDPQKAQEALANAQRLTQDGLDAVRHSVAALRESPLGSMTLLQAIMRLAEETINSGIEVQTAVQGEAARLDPKLELTLYRAVQEGLTNVRRHAQATRVDLLLDFSDDARVALTIADNGAGADPGGDTGYGLLGIQERVELLGGQMDVTSSPGEGFTLKMILPRSGAEETAVSRKGEVLL